MQGMVSGNDELADQGAGVGELGARPREEIE